MINRNNNPPGYKLIEQLTGGSLQTTFKYYKSMENSFMFVSPVLNLTDPVQQLLVAEQEKALRKEEFELSRRRLMASSGRVQELKTRVYYAGKEVYNG